METERAAAIALRVQPVTETSLLVTWFTREHGKLKTLAKGARRPKSPLRGKVDLFYEDEIVFLRSRRSDLHLLHECFLENPRPKLRASVPVLAAASYACELVDAVTEIEDPHVSIFGLLQVALDMLENRSDAVPLIWFELQIMNAAGWRPAFTGTGGTDKVLRSLAGTTAAAVQRVRLTEVQSRAAQTVLWRFHEAQLGRSLRAQKLLKN
jgi:DNA repair protein RecO (recombination protein O)